MDSGVDSELGAQVIRLGGRCLAHWATLLAFPYQRRLFFCYIWIIILPKEQRSNLPPTSSIQCVIRKFFQSSDEIISLFLLFTIVVYYLFFNKWKLAWRSEDKEVTLVSRTGRGVVAHTCNPRTWETEAVGLCELKATLGYTGSIQVVVVHICNPRVWESHTLNPSTREQYGWAERGRSWGRDRNSVECGVWFMETGSCPVGLKIW